MTEQDQIKALAELDEWTGWWCDGCHQEVPSSQVTFEELHDGDCGGECREYKPYLISYDAIIPLIQKHAEPFEMDHFVHTLVFQVLTPYSMSIGKNPTQFSHQHWCYAVLTATPQQLSEALLRATGKWKE